MKVQTFFSVDVIHGVSHKAFVARYFQHKALCIDENQSFFIRL